MSAFKQQGISPLPFFIDKETVMANGIRTGDPHGFNKGRSLKFHEGSVKAGGHIGRNAVEITIKMKTIVQKPLIIKCCFHFYQK